jgi:hypothetical protein
MTKDFIANLATPRTAEGRPPENDKGDKIMKPFTTIAVAVFSLIAVVHLLRLFFHWQVTINGMPVPIWVSIPGFIITGVLAIMLWQEAKK